MISIRKRFITILFCFSAVGCGYATGSDRLDLTRIEWKAASGNHISYELGKRNIPSKLSGKSYVEIPEWKPIHSFPVGFNSFFSFPERSGFHEVTVKAEFVLEADSKYLISPSGLYFPDIGENWELYLNGISIRKELFPGEINDPNYSPSVRRSLKSVTLPIPFGALKKGKNTILLYSVGESNFVSFIQNDHFGFYHAGGYRIASFEEIYESTSEYFEVFLYGIYFIFGIYHILFYITRRQDLYYLYFGLFSFASSVYFFSSSNLIFHKFVNPYSNMDSSYVFRMEYSSLMLILPSFYHFIKNYFYQDKRSGIVPGFFVSLFLTAFLVTWAAPFSWTHLTLKVCQISMIFFLFYILYFSIQTVLQKKRDSRKMLAGIAACIVFAVWDLLDSIFKILGLHYPFFKIAYSLFIVTIISILVSRYIQLYKDAQALNRELSNQKDAFYRFVPADFIRILDKESPVAISIGDNKEKSMTVLFSDIRNFTSISEEIQASQTIAFLNSYLSEMEELVYTSAGFVDKYVGDAVLALFADYHGRMEKENFNSADNAVESAIKMLSAIQRGNLRNEFRIPNRWNLEVGIGINTGSLILGTVGSERRIDTTVIGDAVNLASRLQSLTTLYQSGILISHHTYLQLNRLSDAGIRMIDTAFVKGRSQPVDIYEVFEADPYEIREYKFKTKDRLSEGIGEYRAGKFGEASAIFRELYREEPRDNLSKIYLKRCKLYSSRPPEKDWDGIFRFQTK
ncbi:adenylate/guanylate cyclase domain-containing protein [Leptospira ellisii]|uniref:Adenylate/guanylate cyclase domain-containing protein n=1 Tax=Leptospira ellisii TaxID=2023197 RepID=A0A2N0B429_9LEPT|nr:adenylate/guanylate cyclase domain-containing protein [Leptospira ellisii]MDV6234036.1 adenylate/guanylate cyclase domain-containing protein [Leptospira ellisii]PJZ91289.1 adenylate/guanylate cyclase domain-containing protein [Leptospira ellisii]PKA04225.1 adenylate/guanylate cyclase domain-containing protein [Leptospira ellisii]